MFTVGDLKKELEYSDDKEPLSLFLIERTIFGEREIPLKLYGTTTSAGGRATDMWFVKEK